MRLAVRILFVILAVLLIVPGWSGATRLETLDGRAVVETTPVAAPRRVGRLTFLGGVKLASPARGFGGFSAMTVADGRIVLLNDGGNFVSFALRRGIASDSRFGALPAGPRTGWEKRDRDSESLTRDPATGQLWVGFEGTNAIWRYAAGFARAERAVRPPTMRRWSSNGGPEAFTRFPDGSFVAISESSRWREAPERAGILFGGDPTVAPRRGFRFAYLPAKGFDPSEAAALPSGDLLVLERRVSLPLAFEARLVLVKRGAIRPGGSVRGKLLAHLAAPFPSENYETMAITREGRDTIIWLATDNDGSWWRPSLLMKFRLVPEAAPARSPTPPPR